jgi:hypothetical protein
MVKRKAAPRAGGRSTSAERRRRPARKGPAAARPSSDPEKEYASIEAVARRADSDPEFFQAVIDGQKNVNSVLAGYGMELSQKDAAFLTKGLRTVLRVRNDFAALGGWGRWPV